MNFGIFGTMELSVIERGVVPSVHNIEVSIL